MLIFISCSVQIAWYTWSWQIVGICGQFMPSRAHSWELCLSCQGHTAQRCVSWWNVAGGAGQLYVVNVLWWIYDVLWVQKAQAFRHEQADFQDMFIFLMRSLCFHNTFTCCFQGKLPPPPGGSTGAFSERVWSTAAACLKSDALRCRGAAGQWWTQLRNWSMIPMIVKSNADVPT